MKSREKAPITRNIPRRETGYCNPIRQFIRVGGFVNFWALITKINVTRGYAWISLFIFRGRSLIFWGKYLLVKKERDFAITGAFSQL